MHWWDVCWVAGFALHGLRGDVRWQQYCLPAVYAAAARSAGARRRLRFHGKDAVQPGQLLGSWDVYRKINAVN